MHCWKKITRSSESPSVLGAEILEGYIFLSKEWKTTYISSHTHRSFLLRQFVAKNIKISINTSAWSVDFLSLCLSAVASPHSQQWNWEDGSLLSFENVKWPRLCQRGKSQAMPHTLYMEILFLFSFSPDELSSWI